MIVHTLAFSWHEKSDTIKLHVAAAGENESVALLTPLILIPSHRLLFTFSLLSSSFVLCSCPSLNNSPIAVHCRIAIVVVVVTSTHLPFKGTG